MSTFPISSYLPAHEPWTPAEVRHAEFTRYLLLTGKIGDGESIEELAAFRKLRHLHDGRKRPVDWTLEDRRRHEARVVRVRQSDETTHDPASAGSA